MSISSPRSFTAALPSLPAAFAARLVTWQRNHGRHHLPWQQDRDAYRVWLSEIMLQQTQVAAVIPYYQRFLARFPTLGDLAAAPVDAVLALWSGLGYYARARNLHRCAQAVVERHGGVFPDDPTQLAALPGIGRSTAAAIAAFAYGRRAAILDGNVKRVLCRHLCVEAWPGQPTVERELWQAAEALLPEAEIEAYTQGLMDLGASVCTRRQPRCGECPLAADCQARIAARQDELPVAKPRRTLPERSADFLLLQCGNAVLLQKRPPHGLWGGLLVPPEGAAPTMLAALGLAGMPLTPLPEFAHTFTHFRLHLRPWLCRLPESPAFAAEPDWVWLDLETLADAALPTPIRRLLVDLRASLRG